MNSNKQLDVQKNQVFWQNGLLDRSQRAKRNEHKGAVVWITGLSGSGKSTVASAVEYNLYQEGFQAVRLDGDNVRHGLCADLGFSIEDRQENIRRVGEMAKLLLEQGMVVIVALISPLAAARQIIRNSMEDGDFIEVYCHCDIDICKERDTKGLYAKAEQGLISMFSGISAEYEAPLSPELILHTGVDDANTSILQLTNYLKHRLVAG
jgi:adenylylsulfate kinase